MTNEQKAIDDEECESLVGLAVEECKQVMIDKACEWIDIHSGEIWSTAEYDTPLDELLADFRKGMAGKTNPLFEKCLAKVNPKTRAEVRRNMDYADWTEKACEVIDELCKGLQPHRRNFTIDDFREAMGAVIKESLTTVEIDGKKYKVKKLKPDYCQCEKCVFGMPCGTNQIETPPCEVHNLDESEYFEEIKEESK